MDAISNIINLEPNENLPLIDNHKVNSNDILNGSAENKLSAAESVTSLHNSPLAEKQVLTNVNNNFQNERPNINLPVTECSIEVLSNNSGENIAFLSSEAGTIKAENNSLNLAYETSTGIETCKNISSASVEMNSKPANEFKNDSSIKSDIFSLDEIPVGNVNFPPDASSDKVISDNQKDLRINAAQNVDISVIAAENVNTTFDEELKDNNGSYVIVPDLVDFSFKEQGNVSEDLLGNLTGIDSLSKQPESFPSSTLEGIAAVNIQENKLTSVSAELPETDFADKVPENTTNINNESVVTDFSENCAVSFVQSVVTDSPLVVSDSLVKEVVNNIISSVNTSIEFETGEEISVVGSDKLDISKNNECKEVNICEEAYQVPENTSSIDPDEISPLKIEKVSLGMSVKSPEKFADSEFQSEVPSSNLGQFSDPDFAFKVPELPSNNPFEEFSDSNKPFEQFSDPDFAFKVPQAPSNSPLQQFSDRDFAFKVPQVPSDHPVGQVIDPDLAFKMSENPLTNEGEEQFVDAVQFFRDPSSFQFLENIRTSTVKPESTVPRSSLYVNFDPLHSKFQTNVLRQDNCALITAAMQENNPPLENSDKCTPEVLNKHPMHIAARESLSNVLISFDSPKSSSSVGTTTLVQTPTPPKMFTEEEVQQKLKIHELETQDTYLKKQREMEMQIAKRDELLNFQQIVMGEFCGILSKLAEDFKRGQEKIIVLEAENEKLKEDLKTSAEDLQSVENTFTDFYKRYEQCKGMLKTYKDNEEHLKQTISDLQTKAKEQEQMYHMLQERTEEMLERANVEVDNVKRSGEAQVTVLKAQLKKAEMKISSLESDIKQIKKENSELGGICDDLMAKVSRP